MKANHLGGIISAGGLIGFLAMIPAAAIDPPPEEAVPPAALLEEGDVKPVESKPSPYLGVATMEVPEMLAEHLGLSGRSAIIIRTVVPESPAEKAGLSVNDIITGLDGKSVANPEAFTAAIRERKPGDQLNIGLIRKGKPANIEVTLGNRPADATAHMAPLPYLEGMPEGQADRLRGLFEENSGAFGPGAFPDARFEETFRQMRKRMNRALGEDAGQEFGFQHNSSIRLMDGEGSVEIKTSGGEAEVKVRDKGNKVIWSGPWNTEEDKAAAPAEIRQRIDRVKPGGTGFSFRFGSPQGDAETLGN